MEVSLHRTIARRADLAEILQEKVLSPTKIWFRALSKLNFQKKRTPKRLIISILDKLHQGRIRF